MNISHFYYTSTKNKIDLLPHQINALYGSRVQRQGRVTSGLITESKDTLPYGVLIADETGLGKTVIIGLYLLYLKLNGLADNVIIATPKSVTSQWEEELQSKTGLIFTIINSGKEFRNIYNLNHFNIIVSIDLLKTTQGMNFLRNLEDRQIDVSIIDEAHHVLSYNNTQRKNMSIELRKKSKLMILSTATPFRGKENDELLIKRLLGDNYIYIRRIKEGLKSSNGTPLFKPRTSFRIGISLTYPWNSIYQDLNNKINKLDETNIVKLILRKRLASSVYSFLLSYDKLLSGSLKQLKQSELFGETNDIKGREMDIDINLVNDKLRIYGYNINKLEPKEEYLIKNYLQ